ncbi:MAG: hypothetical protein JOZ08_16175 [Verrucomicrobia bacterium]|nr:hypothetical protein [Verrucomicrobiota bacterium]MBV8278756.1 hypothetical protein [Verrucomicrobiota bacterium]
MNFASSALRPLVCSSAEVISNRWSDRSQLELAAIRPARRSQPPGDSAQFGDGRATGFLVPVDATEEEKFDPQSQDEQEAAGEEPDSPDDSGPPDPTSGKTFLPSSMGISVLVAQDIGVLNVVVQWGDYLFEGGDEGKGEPGNHGAEVADKATQGEERPKSVELGQEAPKEIKSEGQPRTPKGNGLSPLKGYRRIPREESVAIDVAALSKTISAFPVPDSRGLELVATLREVSVQAGLAAGTRSLSLFIVNRRLPDQKKRRYPSWAFQVRMIIKSERAFVARPDLRGVMEGRGDALDEWDTKLANLHYRDVHEFSVGHGVSVHAIESASGICYEVRTSWVPKAEVNRVAPNESIAVTLGMDELAHIASVTEAQDRLMPLVDQYQAWIEAQDQKRSSLSAQNQQTLDDLLANAKLAANRIKAGIELLDDPLVLQAFQILKQSDGWRFQAAPACAEPERPQYGQGTQVAAVPARFYPADHARDRVSRT